MSFSVPTAERATLIVYDVGGRRVRQLYHQILPAGSHPIWWDGRDDENRNLAPGIYFATFSSVMRRETLKIAITR